MLRRWHFHLGAMSHGTLRKKGKRPRGLPSILSRAIANFEFTSQTASKSIGLPEVPLTNERAKAVLKNSLITPTPRLSDSRLCHQRDEPRTRGVGRNRAPHQSPPEAGQRYLRISGPQGTRSSVGLRRQIQANAAQKTFYQTRPSIYKDIQEKLNALKQESLYTQPTSSPPCLLRSQ